MANLPDDPVVRRSQTAALITAPVAALATTIVWLDTPLEAGERLDLLRAHPERMSVAHLLNLLAILLFIPAVAGMHRLLRPRRAKAAAIGASLAAAGLVGWTGILALASAELQVARTLTGTHAVAAAEALPRAPVSAALTALFLLCLFSGLIVLAAALWRAHVVPVWVPVAVTVAVVADIVASTVTAVVVSVWVLLTIAFTTVALARLRDDAVRHAPTD